MILMTETKSYKRSPAIRCWIEHILKGKYSRNDKVLYTLFGETRRVRFIATLVEKKEILTNKITDDTEQADDTESNNMRLEFHFDDGTGLIRAVLWGADPVKYEYLNVGDIIDVIGLIRSWNDSISVSPEILRKLDDPNFILLRSAEILKKIKKGEIQEIPDVLEGVFSDNMPDEIDIEGIIEDNEGGFTVLDPKERVFAIIEKRSDSNAGISIKEISKELNIPDKEIKRYLNDLEMESRVYQSEEGFYQSY